MPSLTLKDKPTVFPFIAFVDQEDLKLSLILNAINPQIGGVLIRGEKGSGKSTIVRALADLLPEIKVVDGCVSTATQIIRLKCVKSVLESGRRGILKSLLER